MPVAVDDRVEDGSHNGIAADDDRTLTTSRFLEEMLVAIDDVTPQSATLRFR